jgi:DNA polymerase
MQDKVQLELDLPPINSLRELAKAENECMRCPLYKDATQAVPGEGRKASHVMLVGEQPGDKEDLSGKPFVGPAGRVLDRALEDAGIPRGEVFVTNAVKHFKHEMRGKRRLHKRPNAHEIERCKIWLDTERAIVKPVAIVALGATAARSLLGRSVTITKARRQDFAPCRRHRLLRHHPPLVPAADRGRSRQAAGIREFRRRPAASGARAGERGGLTILLR